MMVTSTSHKDVPLPGYEDAKWPPMRLEIRLFGRTDTGKSATMFVYGFRPYFYVALDEHDASVQCSRIEQYLRTQCRDRRITVECVQRRKLKPFTDNRQFWFARVSCTTQRAYRSAVFRMRDVPADMVRSCDDTHLYEANVQPVMRFMNG